VCVCVCVCVWRVQSCSTKQYVQNEETQVVNTAWAVLSLIKAQWPDRRPVDRAVQVLMKKQLPNGNWPQEDVKGVFNANCAISYTAYKNIFPIWALGTPPFALAQSAVGPEPTTHGCRRNRLVHPHPVAEGCQALSRAGTKETVEWFFRPRRPGFQRNALVVP
jgi:hypothetical protein